MRQWKIVKSDVTLSYSHSIRGDKKWKFYTGANKNEKFSRSADVSTKQVIFYSYVS